jgi:hypothetical protein
MSPASQVLKDQSTSQTRRQPTTIDDCGSSASTRVHLRLFSIALTHRSVLSTGLFDRSSLPQLGDFPLREAEGRENLFGVGAHWRSKEADLPRRLR